MKPTHVLLWAAACLPVTAAAQASEGPRAAPVTEAGAAVPALQYQSVFAKAPAAAETPPHQGWIAANRAVAGIDEAGMPSGTAHVGPAAHASPAMPAAHAGHAAHSAPAAPAAAQGHSHQHGHPKEGQQ